MALGTNEGGTLTATAFISYHFIAIPHATDDAAGSTNATDNDDESMKDDAANNDSANDDRGEDTEVAALRQEQESSGSVKYNVVAELRVQIALSMSPFVSNMHAMSSKETKSRVLLGIMRKVTRQSSLWSTTAFYFHENEMDSCSKRCKNIIVKNPSKIELLFVHSMIILL